MSEKKESVIKRFGRKIRRIFRGELESEKRLEELRKKYEAKEKNPRYVTWEDFYYCTIGFQKDIAAIKERTNIILCILVPMVAYLISKAII
ncbi:MAG: hypothetical protein N2V78_01760 [Methanophagales archaeon]|nr:hypothetical protein [Methanophagales archaeon]